MKIFINESPFEAPNESTVAEAVSGFDPALGDHLAEGRAYVTDGVGREMPANSPVFSGAIYRVVVSARARADGGDTSP